METFKHHFLNKILLILLDLLHFSKNKSRINIKVFLKVLDLYIKDSLTFINP